MSEFPVLTTLGVLPFVAALVVAALPRGREELAKQFKLAVKLVMQGLTIAMDL